MHPVLAPLHAAFHEPGRRVYRIVEVVVWVLILVSIGVFLAELVWQVDLAGTGAFEAVDQIILVFFAFEIAGRVLSYHPPELDFFELTRPQRLRWHVWGRLRYLAQPMMLIDLFTVLAVVKELRGLRALRLLRLVRARRLFKYSTPFAGIARAFHDNRLLYWFAFTLLGIEVLVGGASAFLVERGQEGSNISSLADGFWWALVTVTTVGFGDVSPVTGLGRAVGAALMLGGLFTLALFAGIIGHTLVTSLLTLREEQIRMSAYIDHVVIFGYNPGARMLLDALVAEVDPGTTVILMAAGDRDPDVPPDFVWIPGDPTKESELDKVRLTHASAVVIVAQRSLPPQQADALTLMTTFTVRSYMAGRAGGSPRTEPLRVITEILEHENVAHAHTAGSSEVVETTTLGFSLLAHALPMPGTGAILNRVATAGALSLYVGRIPEEIETPQTFGSLAAELKRKHDALVIGLRDAV